MKIGIFTGPQLATWPQLRAVWLHADENGYDSAWLWDHLVALIGPLDDPIYEGWTLLASLASITENLEIGHLVTANTLRHPTVLAKMAATIDHTSGGRLVVGMGTGYYAEEHTRYGIDLPPKKERAEMLAESVQILKGMFAAGRFSFAGQYYTVTDAMAEPRPLQDPGPPILLGGAGERLLRNTARYADRWDLPDGSAGVTREHFASKREKLERYCEEIGRDPAEIEKSTSMSVIVDNDDKAAQKRLANLRAYRGWDDEQTRRHTIVGAPDFVAEEIAKWETVGVDHFLLTLWPDTYGDLELFTAEVLPELR
jgi:alkanesulfonate monooxygenase SsuD/methylene tetrahydromethanopterin reductase-like flavin-dependent oxidoreductase (luciferase family)